MNPNILCLLCLIGFPFALPIHYWTKVAPLLIQQQVTWPMAQNYCRENHLELFTIRNLGDKTRLIQELNNHRVTDVVWIGLYNDLDSWYWSDNHLPLKNATLKKWYTGHPDYSRSEYSCGKILQNGYWVSYPCTSVTTFICYDAKNSPSQKFVGYASLNWYNARAYCKQYHTELTSVLNDTDTSMLQQVLKSFAWSSAWFGLTRDTWKWSDGYTPNYLPWLNGQPERSDEWENCGASYHGMILNDPCTNLNYFVCSAYMFKKQQIVKLQVMSDQSILDPAVQSSLLQLINLKLQENGLLVNTTARWRVQADGSIFYKNVKKK